MATQSKRVTTTGICTYCNGEFDKAKMTQHLKNCKGRAAALATDMADETVQKQRLFHILAEGRYNPQYWMHLEIPASEPLFTLDGFLREVWVECCGHLSAFEIAGTSYSDEPEDFSNYSIEIIGAPVQEGKEDDVEEVEDELTDEDEEEYEDLSPEELAEEVGKYLEESGKFQEEMPPEYRANLPDELQAELRKPRSRDELVAFLREQLAALPKESSFFSRESIRENFEEQRRLYLQNSFQRSTLGLLLTAVEDRSLGVRLDKVLKVGQKFKYEYDFGSTTELNLRVISEREGVVQEEDDAVTILARNVAPVILCKVCGKPATQVESGYFNVEANAYCNKCARRNKDEEMMLPIVNSPRVGVCGYTG